MFNKLRNIDKHIIRTHLFYWFIICVLLWALVWFIPTTKVLFKDISQPYATSTLYTPVEVQPEQPAEAVEGAGEPTSYLIDYGKMASLTRVCENHGYTEIWCRNTLAGICWKESQCSNDAIGDKGQAIGAFQINQLYHPNTASQAKDFEWSADYTLTRLEKYGFPQYLSYSISCHNGCGNMAYAEAVKKFSTMFN